MLREWTSRRVGPSPGGRVPEERPAGCAALGRSVTALPARRALAVFCVAARPALLLFRHLLCLSTTLVLLVWTSWSFQTSAVLSVDCDIFCMCNVVSDPRIVDRRILWWCCWLDRTEKSRCLIFLPTKYCNTLWLIENKETHLRVL